MTPPDHRVGFLLLSDTRFNGAAVSIGPALPFSPALVRARQGNPCRAASAGLDRRADQGLEIASAPRRMSLSVSPRRMKYFRYIIHNTPISM